VAELTASRDRLWEAAFAFADDWKEKAFTTVFLEPAKMYYTACGEKDLTDNVEVHGSSVYLAILLSTLGVQCPRLPFLLDPDPISVISFLDALDEKQVHELWLVENLGKDFRSIAACREPRVNGRISNHRSSFIFHGRQPWQVANNAVDPEGPKERRLQLRPYLEQFTRYFSVEVLVPRLSQHLLSRDDTCTALQAVFEDMCKDSGAPGEGDLVSKEEAVDVRHWLWDLEVLPARLCIDRAVALLRHAGLLPPAPGT